MKIGKKKDWLLVLILLAVSCYLPYLIFGVYPLTNTTNATPDEIKQLTANLDLPDYYLNELPMISDEQKQMEADAFSNWDGGKCRFCHSIKANDRDRMAPSLYRIFAKPAGISDNFTYSDALIQMKNNGLIWTPEALDAFMSNPKDFIPGNRMRMEGIEDPDTRKLIINYIMRESR